MEKKNLGISKSQTTFDVYGNLEWIYDKQKTMQCPLCGEKIYRTFARNNALQIIIFAGWGPCACSINDMKRELDGEWKQGRGRMSNAFVN